MYTLIGNPQTRAFRVLWALEEMGLPYQLMPAGPHSQEIKTYNPSGKVPALLVDEDVIVDSVAIIQYLADKHGVLTHPAGTLARARQDSFTQMICDDFDGTCWTMAKHSFVLPEELRNKSAIKPGAQWDITRAAQSLEGRLSDSTWLTGDTFTIPDLLLTHCSNWMNACGLGSLTGKSAALVERAKARAAYGRAMDIRTAS